MRIFGAPLAADAAGSSLAMLPTGTFAIPKSSTFTKSGSPSFATSITFSGLRSRWTIPSAVRARDSARDLARDVERAAELEGPLRDHLAQRVPFDELENEEERAVLELAEVGGGGDVRMVDVRGGHRLALEAGDHLRQAAHLGVKDLHREALAHVGVLRLVDGAHSPFAEQAIDPVATRQDRSDERLRAARARRRLLLFPGRRLGRPGCLPSPLGDGLLTCVEGVVLHQPARSSF